MITYDGLGLSEDVERWKQEALPGEEYQEWFRRVWEPERAALIKRWRLEARPGELYNEWDRRVNPRPRVVTPRLKRVVTSPKAGWMSQTPPPGIAPREEEKPFPWMLIGGVAVIGILGVILLRR